jgi:orotate phosphoribosyltransferase
MQNYQRDFITLSTECHALTFGTFTLKSGRQSPYFFNAGVFHTGEALKKLGQCYAQALLASAIEFDVIFGPAYKGIPLACATSIALSNANNPIPFAYNRKEAKDHGEGGMIVGAPLNQRVLIIDDVITAGTAIRESINLIKQNNGTPAGIIVALDRQEKGQHQLSAIEEIQNEFKIPVISIITLQDIMAYLKSVPNL